MELRLQPGSAARRQGAVCSRWLRQAQPPVRMILELPRVCGERRHKKPSFWEETRFLVCPLHLRGTEVRLEPGLAARRRRAVCSRWLRQAQPPVRMILELPRVGGEQRFKKPNFFPETRFLVCPLPLRG
jgi:hypothetical protein